MGNPVGGRVSLEIKTGQIIDCPSLLLQNSNYILGRDTE